MGNSRAGDPRPEPAPAAPGEAFEPEPGLGDPNVGDVPMTMPRPDESEAQAAERVARDAGQDAWGEPEDQPDHEGNEVYLQQDETRR